MGNAFVRGRSYALILLACSVVYSNSAPVAAKDQLEDLARQVGVVILAESTSDRVVRDRCKQQIPYEKMSASARQRAVDLVDAASQYRRMPCLQYEVDPNIYQFLLNHPDVAVSTWRAMGISKLQMSQVADFEYIAESADGSEGDADVLWRDGNQCLFIVEGRYKSPLLPNTINASALVWLRYRFVESNNGATLVNQQVETFIHFPSAAIDTIARLATTITNTILDRNVFEVSLYARMMSRAAEKEPEWIAQLAGRMDGVPQQRGTELIRISRGQSPTEGAMLPAATIADLSGQRLRTSGEFRNFETSLYHLNTHVPLVAGDVRHKPSYGKKIGVGHPLMAQPAMSSTTEARRAMAVQEERQRRERLYSEMSSDSHAKGMPRTMILNDVPPVSTSWHDETSAAIGELMPAPSPPVFPEYSRNTREDRKASSGTFAPNTDVTKRTSATSTVSDLRETSGSPAGAAKVVSLPHAAPSRPASKPEQAERSRRVPLAAGLVPVQTSNRTAE